ncbi:MAG: MBOAT family protein [Lachnospiraceae bacterium]|nr:MBOAT family protein [Lachnospiraceae bacterium]
MIFSSVFFVWIFLPTVIALYYVSSLIFRNDPENKIKANNVLLLIASLVFYGLGGYRYLFLLLAVLLINYFGARVAGKGIRTAMIITVMADIGLLSVFKFADTFTEIILPLGISFYIFQSVSYVVDVYQKKTEIQTDFIKFSLYVSFFPQLVAGPIVKYTDIEKQLSGRVTSTDKFFDGMIRFCMGMAKKVLIANTLAKPVDAIFNGQIKGLGAAVTWFGAICYILQLYYDFSGYSDMAIGLAKIFGFELKENFDHPYASSSIQEFWRRWHISLSNWFKEYVYIPLGGSRCKRSRIVINLLIVFALTGIWHGAKLTFVTWGLFNGLLIITERILTGDLLKKNPVKILNRLYTLCMVTIGFAVFRSESMSQALLYLKEMFSKGSGAYTIFSYFSMRVMIALLAGMTVAFPVYTTAQKRFESGKYKTVWENASALLALILLALSMVEIIAGSYNPFLYFQF